MSRRARRGSTAPTAALPDRLTALAEAVEHADGHVAAERLEEGRTSLARAGERLRLSAEHTVVALAGATGSGKSSLFNALAGLDLSAVGVRRPTTSSAHACVWDPDGAEPLLAWLGIPRRHQVARESALDADTDKDLQGLVLLDLPDHDSTEVAHRLEVDRLVGLVDLLVWVVDPQKYADAALHERYLRALAGHGAVTVVVLNQVDTLDPADVDECVADLRRLLDEDGLGAARVLTTSACTGTGIDELRGLLAGAVQDRVAASERIAADLDGVVDRLVADLAPDLSPDRAPERAGRWTARREDSPVAGIGRGDRENLLAALGAAAGVPVVAAAVERAHRARAVRATGLPWTRWLRGLRPDPLRRLHLDRRAQGELESVARTSLPSTTPVQRSQVDIGLRRVGEAASAGLAPAWAPGVRRAARSHSADLPDALDREIAGTDLGMTRAPRWWSAVGAVQWLFAAAVIVGFAWLAVAFAVAWLQLPSFPLADLSTPVGELPLPTLLLLGGLLGGVVLAALSRWWASVGARRRRRRAEARLREGIARVADELVLAPMSAVLVATDAVHADLGRAVR